MREATSTRLPWTARSLAQLTLVRFREFLREPEAVFWTFFFPVVLAIGLGIAFRNKPADVLTVSVVRGAADADTLAARLTRAGGLRVRMLDADEAARALRTGEVALVATPRLETYAPPSSPSRTPCPRSTRAPSSRLSERSRPSRYRRS